MQALKKAQSRPKEMFLARTKCGCMAQKHELVNNCVSCGKVVCVKEGEGPCLYCGRVVTRPDGKFVMNDEELFPSLPTDERVKASQQRSAAIQHVNRLVERSHNEQQNIFDEQVDYYQITENKWIDEEGRKKAIERLIEKKALVDREQFKTNVSFDAVTGQFVRKQFAFDEEAFKEESRAFLKSNEEVTYQAKMDQIKTNWDARMLKNQKLESLCIQLIGKGHSKQEAIREQSGVIGLIIEEDQN